MSSFSIQKAIDILKKANKLVGLTGAGISTPSGIPDFRSPGSGAWEKVDPFEVASIYGFSSNPQRFYDWLYPLAQLTVSAKPNAAHLAMAQLEANGPLTAIVTQNIDMLHTKAGSKTVFEVHGHVREATCISCAMQFDGEPIFEQLLATRLAPLCPKCGGAIKPDVVLFGEMLPYDILQQAEAAVESCDVMIVVGSSLEVGPVNQMPVIAKRNGAKLIIVNLGNTHLDSLADVVIHEDVVDVLPELAAVFQPKY